MPGMDGKVIKQGDLLTVIKTPKGTYIRLVDDGRFFAVRNRKDAENFGEWTRPFVFNLMCTEMLIFERNCIDQLHSWKHTTRMRRWLSEYCFIVSNTVR